MVRRVLKRLRIVLQGKAIRVFWDNARLAPSAGEGQLSSIRGALVACTGDRVSASAGKEDSSEPRGSVS